MAEIIKVFKEDIPNLRFIGKKVKKSRDAKKHLIFE